MTKERAGAIYQARARKIWDTFDFKEGRAEDICLGMDGWGKLSPKDQFCVLVTVTARFRKARDKSLETAMRNYRKAVGDPYEVNGVVFND
jgi:hypothetical protein